jgi:hypothetical protein
MIDGERKRMPIRRVYELSSVLKTAYDSLKRKKEAEEG